MLATLPKCASFAQVPPKIVFDQLSAALPAMIVPA